MEGGSGGKGRRQATICILTELLVQLNTFSATFLIMVITTKSTSGFKLLGELFSKQ